MVAFVPQFSSLSRAGSSVPDRAGEAEPLSNRRLTESAFTRALYQRAAKGVCAPGA